MVYVACSGGIGGARSTPLCSRTRYTTYCASRSGPQYSHIAVYASAPAARCIPLASVTGIEPVGHWALEARPFPELTPMILFSGLPAGESDPVAGGRTPCCWSDTSDSRGARPGRQLTRALPPAPPADRATSATPAGVADELGEDIPNSSASVTARATSATLALYAFGDDSHHLPAPSRGKKERKLF